jgi:hypothetical protein
MFWVIQVVIVSLVIIFLLHNIYFFFKETLTVPKMKDMVKRPQQKYDALFRELRMRNEESNGGNAVNENLTNANDEMKNELKRYLMELNAPAPHNPEREPEPQPQPQSNFIEMGSAYQ